MGIHNRRTDYLEFRRKRLGLDNLYEDYFEDAMEYFRDEYWDTTVVFVYVSDDMKWGRRTWWMLTVPKFGVGRFVLVSFCGLECLPLLGCLWF